MTRQDRTMLLGCVVVAVMAIVSLAGHPMTKGAAAAPETFVSKSQSLQSARMHSLAGASARAVSLF
jgi:hypothetical protein